MAQPVDCQKTFETVKAIIDRDYKAGKISREKARQVIEGARENYRKQTINKEMDRINAQRN